MGIHQSIEDSAHSLEVHSPQDFARWLVHEFRDLRQPLTQGPPHIIRDIMRWDHHLEEFDVFGAIYAALGDQAKENFEQGIKEGFSELRGQPDAIVIGEDLLHVAGQVASPKVLPVAIDMFNSGFLDEYTEEERVEFFACILDITAGMARHQEPRYSTVPQLLRGLKENPYFNYSYSPMVFVALCTAEPDTFYEHLTLVRQDIATLTRDIGTDDIHITGKRFMHYAGLERLFMNFDNMSISPPDSHQTLDYDDWLVHAVFAAGVKMDRQQARISYEVQGQKAQEYTLTPQRIGQLEGILRKELK